MQAEKGINLNKNLLHLHKAVTLINSEMPGGSSRPWLVAVETEKGYDNYVVKPFSAKDMQQLPYLNKEVYASIIAQELEIPIPVPALVKFDNNFIGTLTEQQRERIISLDRRIVFDCKYHEGYAEFGNGYNPSKFNYVDAQTIFAFDVLIRNFDRRKDKPNLLLAGNEYLCIDHDRSMDIRKTFTEYCNLDGWSAFVNAGSSGHLFHSYLKSKKAEVDFIEFKEIFKTFNTRTLEKTVCTLTDHGIDTEDFYEVKNYLHEIIGNKAKFYTLLNHLIG